MAPRTREYFMISVVYVAVMILHVPTVLELQTVMLYWITVMYVIQIVLMTVFRIVLEHGAVI